ncbi:MAG: hypothetical protein US62_C0019G0009 [Candidatus Woesebacteria bacterium GW2011_GWA1_37_8]|uniref:Uncharacterized protein n=2 Tax=Candidatus Woeseibacteriota TaxID=1752722 RepID=A0A0G0LEX8_9BACT|nr:MAG: hypothetical protein US39_C0002G0008 [Microgenomates group bacterium GW2011_GWC1_37_12b]KKQ44977.1 MAG: hypothetical protein US62_C0019G0009 [Candidatus Woesebacteria bacterium GW2011_GWA1_37_8]KKQ86505.1 MAG: hypothetical protein UT10_C0023G0007 [Candidatus Woesebacteria bacterium GW2011_GWB1_38_8b]
MADKRDIEFNDCLIECAKGQIIQNNASSEEAEKLCRNECIPITRYDR